MIEKWIKCRIPSSWVNIVMTRTFSFTYQGGDVSALQCGSTKNDWGLKAMALGHNTVIQKWWDIKISFFGLLKNQWHPFFFFSFFLFVFILFFWDTSFFQSGNMSLSLCTFHLPTYIASIYSIAYTYSPHPVYLLLWSVFHFSGSDVSPFQLY